MRALFFLIIGSPRSSTLFPYTTLFRSSHCRGAGMPSASLPRPPLGRRASGLVRWRRSLLDRKSTRLNSSHVEISYAVFCLKKKSSVAEDQIRGAQRYILRRNVRSVLLC